MTFKHENLVVAYGSNLNGSDWTEFAKIRGHAGDCLHFEERVVLPDFKLIFDVHSKARNGGVLNIKPALGHIVFAGLFSANDTGIELLRRKEGVPFQYAEETVAAIRSDGSQLRALTYIVPQDRSRGFVLPSDEYLKICQEGYEAHELDTSDLLAGACNHSVKPLNSIFTYGTLMRDEERFSAMQGFQLSTALMAQCFGQLLSNSAYPGLDLREDGFAWGDYFVAEEIEGLLQLTDQVERFAGFASSENLFRRTCVQVDVGGLGQRFAWLYAYDHFDLGPSIISNDWRHHNGTRGAFVERLVEEHASKVADFNEQISERYYRLGQKNENHQLSRRDIIELVDEGIHLSERDLAQVSHLWSALT